MKITIDQEEYEIDKVITDSYGLPMIEIGNMEFYVAESSEEAGIKARERWQDMAENDKKEFICIVGEEALIAWCLGESYGPGSTAVNSLEEWLDLWLDTPEEEFASYDGVECEVEDADDELIEELGFTPTVAYRHN